MLWVQKMPNMYYAYIFFPVYFWNQILRNYSTLAEGLYLSLQKGIVRFIFVIAIALLFLEALVRWSVCFLFCM